MESLILQSVDSVKFLPIPTLCKIRLSILAFFVLLSMQV